MPLGQFPNCIGHATLLDIVPEESWPRESEVEIYENPDGEEGGFGAGLTCFSIPFAFVGRDIFYLRESRVEIYTMWDIVTKWFEIA